MAVSNSHSQNGFCSKTLIFHSLRPSSFLPPQATHLSVTDFIFSLLNTTTTTAGSLIDATTRHRIPYTDVKLFVRNLAAALRQPPVSLTKGNCAFIISHNSSYLPILFLSLFSIGVTVSPANPASSISEISRQIRICKPVVIFATVESVRKVSETGFNNRIVVIESSEFESMMRVDRSNGSEFSDVKIDVSVSQSDTAAILYSSGTTGNTKGVRLTHRNLISSVAGAITSRKSTCCDSPAVYLCTVPYFHVYGFTFCVRMVACGESLVSVARFDLRLIVRSIEEFRVCYMAVAPPVVVALVDGNNERLVNGADLRSLDTVFSGGAPLTVAVIRKFKRRFQDVSLVQTYGLTETTGAISRVASPYESTIVGTVGRLIAHCEAKIVDPNTGVSLPPMNHGELWVRGPSIMKGYVDEKQGINTMVDSDGWLRTGDLCFFNNEGFLFVVDRLKELIKYKGYQVPPAELEQILHSHPDITEAAVIPYPDEAAGQVPMGFVVKRKGSTIDETQVKDYVAKQVAPYKKLRRVCFIDSIPKNAPGKVLRKELMKMAVNSKL
ncbi:putative AMP-dependent synthetase/ligase, AMP-binding enzyme domain, ANL domain-containing protein [Helianthus annuus]|nr:putative AMP-dependent synthetase/ligase, AMP-binding enzyme domain, ANL domain-containing protein [Helianthus annuus]